MLTESKYEKGGNTMEKFTEWLQAQLIGDGFFEEDEDWENIDLTDKEDLLATTDIDEDDLENYKADYVEHCKAMNETPNFDVEW